jgi:nicotinamide phosphoribosyltransferase
MFNPTTLIDGYKLDHRRQYPAKTEYVYSNWTPRGSRTGQKEVVFFGLQYSSPPPRKRRQPSTSVV